MRRLTLAILLLVATAAFAQEEQPPPPPPPPPADYSKDALLQIFGTEIEKENAERNFQHQFGAISFKALGMRWRIGYLPFLMPLPGSEPWRPGERWPDPFRLTGTQLASPPRTWRQMRDMSAELRRIERRLKESQTVKVTPE